MNSSTLNSSTDCFILDRDQDAAPVNPCAHSTPKALGDNCENTQSLIIEDIYEIINTGTEHIVLYHESAPISILETAQSDTLPSRKFTNFNPIIPDDEFMSPPRDYEHMDNWLYRPHDGSISPISSDSSSIGYFSGSDWTTDSSWMSYDSMVQSIFQPPISSPFRPISPLLPTMDVSHQSRGLSQPPQGREIIRSERTAEERNGEINQEEANKASQT